MVGEGRQSLPVALRAHGPGRLVVRGRVRPVRPEAELSVRMAESIEEMRFLKWRLEVCPTGLAERVERAEAAARKHVVDVLARAHAKAGQVRHAEAPGEFLDHVEIGARAFRRLD